MAVAEGNLPGIEILLEAGAVRSVIASTTETLSYDTGDRRNIRPGRHHPLTIPDANLQVTTVLNTGITGPIGIVFPAANDFLVLEKASVQIKRVTNELHQANPVLDLAVNSNSERGLLSMLLHPNFPTTPFAYIRWTECSTGADPTVVSEVPLPGNRADRFIWTGTTLIPDINLIRLRSRQTDNTSVPGHPCTNNANEQGNHNGGGLKLSLTKA